MKLQGKVAFITGASGGIGAAVARLYAREGADVALAARTVEKMEKVATDIRQMGRKALVCRCDVLKDEDILDAVSVVGLFNHVDRVADALGITVNPGYYEMAVKPGVV